MSWLNVEFQVTVYDDGVNTDHCLSWAETTLSRLLVRAEGYRTNNATPSALAPTSAVAPVFRSILPTLARASIPAYLPSWFPTLTTHEYPSVLPLNEGAGVSWEVQLSDQSNCDAEACVEWIVAGLHGVQLRPNWDRKVNLGTNGIGYLYLNQHSNSLPSIQWIRDGNTYNTVAPVDESSPDQPTLVHIARSMVRVN